MTNALVRKQVLPSTIRSADEAGWLRTNNGDFCIETEGGMIAFFHVSPSSDNSIVANVGLANRHLNATS